MDYNCSIIMAGECNDYSRVLPANLFIIHIPINIQCLAGFIHFLFPIHSK